MTTHRLPPSTCQCSTAMCACERPPETQHQQPHVKKGGAAMQTPTSRKVSPSTFITNKVHLPLIAMMTAVFLIIFFSSAGQTESTAVATIPTTCPGELLTNGDFELPLETAGGAPLNWSTSQWIRSSYLSREHGNAHSGVGSARIVAQVLNDSWFWQEVTVEPQTWTRIWIGDRT